MDKNLRQAVLACPEVLRYLDLPGIERAALGFEIMLVAVSRDDYGHFYKYDSAPCPHKKGGKVKPKGKAKYGKLAEKLVRVSDAMKRINNSTGETITASDGKPAIFNEKSVKHVVGDHSKSIGKIRMNELGIAQDTTATGLSFESVNKGKLQTEFIKEYDTGAEKKYFYTSRRGNSNVVYSWHSISESNYKRKKTEWESQQK